MKSRSHKSQPDKFEQQIKQRLDTHQSPYDPAAWKNMEVLLDQQDKQKVVGFWYKNRYMWRAVAVACLLVMCVQLYDFSLSPIPVGEQSSTQNTLNNAETKSVAAMPIVSNNSNIGVVPATTMPTQTTATTQSSQQLVIATTNQYNNVDNTANTTEKTNWSVTPNLTTITKTIANDQQFYSSNTNITSSFPTATVSSPTSVRTTNTRSSTTTISALKLPALALSTNSSKAILPVLPIVSSPKIELPQTNISIAPSSTFASNSKTDMPVPKHKKRFWVGVQTAFAETFNNKNHRTTNNIPIGIAAAYNFAPQWELESGAYYNTQQQFTEVINKNAAQSHLAYTVKSLTIEQIEVPLLARYYMPANNPKWRPYIAVGTALVWHLGQDYKITDCNCSTESMLDSIVPFPSTSVDTTRDVETQDIGPTTERFRYDLGQIHLGTQYALNDKWLLQAEINYKTNFQPIYIRNASSRTLLVEPYRNNQTALQVGLARRF
jgi:outer membrane protein W